MIQFGEYFMQNQKGFFDPLVIIFILLILILACTYYLNELDPKAKAKPKQIDKTISLIQSTKGKPYENEFKKEIQPILDKDKKLPLSIGDVEEIANIYSRYELDNVAKIQVKDKSND